LGKVVEDLLSHGEGLDVCQRPITAEEIGLSPCEVATEPVLAVIRDGELRRYSDPVVSRLQAGDEIIGVRDTTEGSCTSVLGGCGTPGQADDVG
jgi:voltage-gated potassium channel